MKYKKDSTFHHARFDLETNGWMDYELLDSGSEKKYERFGSYRLIRFEKKAVWKQSSYIEGWGKADAEFVFKKENRIGKWVFFNEKPRSWSITVDKLNISLNLSDSRHIGIFPEQIENWRWLEQKIIESGKNVNMLNLFGYTGVATIYAARAGASITHIDASRKALEIGKKSLRASGLDDKPVKWLVDDSVKFVAREIRRGQKYDGIIIDPPKFGRGPKGEIWKLEDDIFDLLKSCAKLLSENPLFFILTAYDADTTPQDISRWFEYLPGNEDGITEYGNLIQLEKSTGRKITQAVYGRWSRG